MPLDPVIGSGLGVLGGIIGKIGQRKQQRRNIRQQTAANKELAEYAYGKDLEQWERQNLYNAPTQQMARLKEAGLNPNLIYGTGTSATQSQATSPQYQNVRAGEYSQQQSPLQALDVLGAFQDFQMKNAHIRKANAEADAAGKFYEGRANITGYRGLEERKSYKYFNRIEEGQQRSNRYRFFDYQLQAQQEQARGYKAGASLREMELAWLETMKKMGIGRAFVIPMMRMMMGR